MMMKVEEQPMLDSHMAGNSKDDWKPVDVVAEHDDVLEKGYVKGVERKRSRPKRKDERCNRDLGHAHLSHELIRHYLEVQIQDRHRYCCCCMKHIVAQYCHRHKKTPRNQRRSQRWYFQNEKQCDSLMMTMMEREAVMHALKWVNLNICELLLHHHLLLQIEVVDDAAAAGDGVWPTMRMMRTDQRTQNHCDHSGDSALKPCCESQPWWMDCLTLPLT